MGEVNVDLGDLRKFIPKIRAAAKGRVVQSACTPEGRGRADPELRARHGI